MAVLRGWRFVGFVSCIVGAVGLTLYPVIVDSLAEKITDLITKSMQATK